MIRVLAVVVGCAALAVACGGSPTSPSAGQAARVARLSRTRFLAYGDSLTSGEITAPIAATGTIGKLVIVPGASYPEVLQSELKTAYPSQAASISVMNMGKGAETIFDGILRFEDVFPSSRAEVVLLQEGVNGLSFAGPDGSTALMRSMVQEAKNGSAMVFVGSMIPTLADRQRTQNATALVAYDNDLETMCVQEGVTYVDLYNGMLADAGQLIGVDGLHPNEAGYRRIANLFFAAIKRELEK
jgi:lysophospholipase L1-like esterase